MELHVSCWFEQEINLTFSVVLIKSISKTKHYHLSINY